MAGPADLDALHWQIIDELRASRCTPSSLADLIGESRQLLSQRLRDLGMVGYVEKINTGLYELAEDPNRGIE